MLFAGWRGELAECRKFAPAARNYAAARLMAEVGLRVNEACQLDLDDVKWDLGRFGKIHVRMGKGARGSGPRERMVPLINNARATLEWFVQDVWGHFDDDHTRPGAPLLPSERKNPDGTCARVGDEALRAALAGAAAAHLPDWRGRVTPHLLRHYCASQLYANGMDLAAIQEVLGHSWVVTTMNYIHVHRTHVEDAWICGQQRAAGKLKGLLVTAGSAARVAAARPARRLYCRGRRRAAIGQGLAAPRRFTGRSSRHARPGRAAVAVIDGRRGRPRRACRAARGVTWRRAC